MLLWIPTAAADEPPEEAGEGPLDDWPHCDVLAVNPETDPPTYTLDEQCLFPLPPIGP